LLASTARNRLEEEEEQEGGLPRFMIAAGWLAAFLSSADEAPLGKEQQVVCRERSRERRRDRAQHG
jgi:hypothetical protein